MLSAAMVVAPTLQSPTLAAVERETTALFDHVAPTVVLIETADGFGSGFFVSPLGHILTNRHVVGTQGTVRVRLHDGRRVTGTVVERGAKGVDLALVKVAVKGAPALPLAPTRSLRIGTWAGSVGHGRGGVWTLTTGLISNAHGGRARGVLQTQIPLNPGASGGPVFDRRGRVVGVVASGLVDSDAVNFAITAETALASLPALRPVTNCLSVGAPKGASVFVNGTRIGAGPLVTLVAEPGTYEIEVDVAGTRRKESVTFPERRTVTFRAR
ncbi:MAG: trypsin-like peptidase domain-containing protein [Myxococcota bacterium]